jgi:mannose-6-phosphate isomerase-like protein (cupin superfamily)
MPKQDPKIHELWKSIFQNWPVPVKEQRSMKLLREGGRIFNFVDEGFHPTHSTILVSTDKLTAGFFRLLPSAYYFASSHANSDEFYYVITGTVTILINDTDSFDVKAGESFIIKNGDKHQVFNFTTDMVEVLFCLAPEL